MLSCHPTPLPDRPLEPTQLLGSVVSSRMDSGRRDSAVRQAVARGVPAAAWCLRGVAESAAVATSASVTEMVVAVNGGGAGGGGSVGGGGAAVWMSGVLTGKGSGLGV